MFNVFFRYAHLVRQCDREDRLEHSSTARVMLIEFSPKRLYFDSASVVFVALDPGETMKSNSDSQTSKKRKITRDGAATSQHHRFVEH